MRSSQNGHFDVVLIKGKFFRFPKDADYGGAYLPVCRKHIKNYDQLSNIEQLVVDLPKNKAVEADLARELIERGIVERYEHFGAILPHAKDVQKDETLSAMEILFQTLHDPYEILFDVMVIIASNRGEVVEMTGKYPPTVNVFQRSWLGNFLTGNTKGKFLGSISLSDIEDYIAGQSWLILRNKNWNKFSTYGNVPDFTEDWYESALYEFTKKSQDLSEKSAIETLPQSDSEPQQTPLQDVQESKLLDFLETMSQPSVQSDGKPRQARPKDSETVKAGVKISKKLAQKLEEDMACMACNCVFKGWKGVDISAETLRCPRCNQLLVI